MAEPPIKLFASRSEQYPEASDADRALTGARAMTAAIPFVGGSAVELMSLVSSPLVARRDQWFKDLADDMDVLEAKVVGLNREKLALNESFCDAVVQTTRIALGTRREDKRAMLRNALLKVALGEAPDEDKRQIFLNAIEAFTPTHILVLNFFWRGTQHSSWRKGCGIQ